MHTTERFRPSAGRTQNPMNPVDVTVIIPAHNAEETIGERLAQEQTDPAAEEGPPRRVTRAGAAGSGSAPL